MLLKEKSGGHIVEIERFHDLCDPVKTHVKGCLEYGEELQDAEMYEKAGLTFLSGEPLPKCWTDPHYRDHEIRARR
ncbi:hypothetical protein [Hahella ganghwensis]|uniref:hypothetical protein n=1 Tax=Hahella ganghwensis TaxID=286420 RepID=UPI00035DB6FB|nr:hypothetical protein [Hahella ganghwensis]